MPKTIHWQHGELCARQIALICVVLQGTWVRIPVGTISIQKPILSVACASAFRSLTTIEQLSSQSQAVKESRLLLSSNFLLQGELVFKFRSGTISIQKPIRFVGCASAFRLLTNHE
jgi:hypothetical protein